jgi:hypothetical protein
VIYVYAPAFEFVSDLSVAMGRSLNNDPFDHGTDLGIGCLNSLAALGIRTGGVCTT